MDTHKTCQTLRNQQSQWWLFNLTGILVCFHGWYFLNFHNSKILFLYSIKLLVIRSRPEINQKYLWLPLDFVFSDVLLCLVPEVFL